MKIIAVPPPTGRPDEQLFLHGIVTRPECANNSETEVCIDTPQLNCSRCHLISYCSMQCRAKHWPFHKKYCLKGLARSHWVPNFNFKGDIFQILNKRASGHDSEWSGPIWDQCPPIDVLNLAKNEGTNFTGNLNLFLHSESGIRNALQTVISAPDNPDLRLSIDIADRDMRSLFRTVLTLLILTRVEDSEAAAESILHLWYSAFFTTTTALVAIQATHEIRTFFLPSDKNATKGDNGGGDGDGGGSKGDGKGGDDVTVPRSSENMAWLKGRVAGTAWEGPHATYESERVDGNGVSAQLASIPKFVDDLQKIALDDHVCCFFHSRQMVVLDLTKRDLRSLSATMNFDGRENSDHLKLSRKNAIDMGNNKVKADVLRFMRTPSWRMAYSKFQQDGILLPYGYSRRNYVLPNPFLFDLEKSAWLPDEPLDPTIEWSPSILSHPCPAPPEDVYGKMFFYVRDFLMQAHAKLRAPNGPAIKFCVSRIDLLNPAMSQRSKLAHGKYDRIECGDIGDLLRCDRNAVLGPLSQYLRPIEKNRHATLICMTRLAVDEFSQLDDAKIKATAPPFRGIPIVNKYLGDEKLETGVYFNTADPVGFRRRQGLRITQDMDVAFARFVKESDFNGSAVACDLIVKRKHTIVDKWLTRLEFHAEPTEEEFRRRLGWCASGTERWIEMQPRMRIIPRNDICASKAAPGLRDRPVREWILSLSPEVNNRRAGFFSERAGSESLLDGPAELVRFHDGGELVRYLEEDKPIKMDVRDGVDGMHTTGGFVAVNLDTNPFAESGA